MTILETIFMAVLALVAAGAGAVYFVHMLQLCSYQFGQYRLESLLLLLPWILNQGRADRGAYYGVMLLGYCVLNRPKKAKKPLVYTARVKRLLGTSAVLYVLALIPGLLLPYGMAIFGVVLLCTPLVVLLANFINTPVEKMVARYYVEDRRHRKLWQNQHQVFSQHPSFHQVPCAHDPGQL